MREMNATDFRVNGAIRDEQSDGAKCSELGLYDKKRGLQ